MGTQLRGRMRAEGERGVTLPLLAFLMVALCGMVAMAVDVGRLALTRRQVQNAADAGALAGVAWLPGDKATAQTKAVDWATRNGISAAEVQSVVFTKTEQNDDTITVNVRRNVPYSFAKVLGLSGKDITAAASARVFTVQGAQTPEPDGSGGIFPYAVWAGNAAGAADVAEGKTVVFRTNDYAAQNVKPILPQCKNSGKKDNCNWKINGNDFKGFFHWKNGYTYVDMDVQEVVSQGGNAFGNEPLDELTAAYNNDRAIWLPVINYADDSGKHLYFRIVSFVCIDITSLDKGKGDFAGTVLDSDSDQRCKKSTGIRTGGDNPPAGFPVVYTFAMIK